jgi:hypothetical protein
MVVRIYWHFSLSKKISRDVKPNNISCEVLIIRATGVFQNNEGKLAIIGYEEESQYKCVSTMV